MPGYVHSNIITYCDITMDVPSNIITHCDFTMGIHNHVITHCDVIMSGHCDVILIDLHWPDWSPFRDHIPVYHIKQVMVWNNAQYIFITKNHTRKGTLSQSCLAILVYSRSYGKHLHHCPKRSCTFLWLLKCLFVYTNYTVTITDICFH